MAPFCRRLIDGVSVVVKRVAQIWCGLVWGHATMFEFKDGRMFLRCAECLYQTPGWVCKREPGVTHGAKPRTDIAA